MIRTKLVLNHIHKGGEVFWLFLLLLYLVTCTPCAALTQEEHNTISTYEKVAPSIVNITTSVCHPDFFFCTLPESGSASGVVIGQEGVILTNYHSIENTQSIQVTLGNGRRLKAELVATEPGEDIAILKVEVGDTPLQAIPLGDSETLQVGEKVLAIGNPFGLGQTLTVGTVSMLHRNIRSGDQILRNMIQTDASINPGNAGGALVSSKGELIGMSTIVLSPTGSNVGIGLAISSNRINKVIPDLMHPWSRLTGWILAFFIIAWVIWRIRSGTTRVWSGT